MTGYCPTSIVQATHIYTKKIIKKNKYARFSQTNHDISFWCFCRIKWIIWQLTKWNCSQRVGCREQLVYHSFELESNLYKFQNFSQSEEEFCTSAVTLIYLSIFLFLYLCILSKTLFGSSFYLFHKLNQLLQLTNAHNESLLSIVSFCGILPQVQVRQFQINSRHDLQIWNGHLKLLKNIPVNPETHQTGRNTEIGRNNTKKCS